MLDEIRRAVEELGDENLRAIRNSILRDVDTLNKSLSENEVAGDLRIRASMRFLYYAMDLFEKARKEFQAIIEEVSKSLGERGEDFRRALSHFMPLFIEYVNTADNNSAWYWYDLELGNTGLNVEELSSVYAPSLVVFYALHTYALPQNSVLLIEEPEAHAHPSLSLFLGYFLNKLVQDSERRLRGGEKPWIFHIVTATHSMDFLRGALMAGEDTVEVYVFNRDVAEGKITVEPWSGGAVVPGLTEPALLTILSGVVRGEENEANRDKHS
ncbi:ATP-binding protein [Vulcanisaeta sp. JCM 14467]|uniref:ATP-binding protein n=1 Tax=Vulcanisaeta sp. JCM 14467 TaxID=1295370 RepID=UPI0006D123A2|nr:ATP-binding protein [Vulcanisaeta sp. JCM 14467]